MRISLKSSALGLAAFTALAIAAPSAWAGCGEIPGPVKAPTAWEHSPSDGAKLIRIANQGGDSQGSATIVGLWRITMYAGPTASAPVADFGYAQWHSDGTEIMFSGGRAPNTGDVCLGVWAQTTSTNFHLTHHALGYDPTIAGPGNPTGYVGESVITEDVHLINGGAGFTGTYSINAYPAGGGGPFPVVSGLITGVRKTPTN